jgi:hypothetical protein
MKGIVEGLLRNFRQMEVLSFTGKQALKGLLINLYTRGQHKAGPCPGEAEQEGR